MKLSTIKVDPVRFSDGAWVHDIPEMPGLSLRVRAMGCNKDRDVQAAAMDAIPREKRLRGRVEGADMDQLMTARLLDAILLDWKGIEGDDGEAVPYSREAAEGFLNDPSLVRFRNAVVWAASIVAEDTADDLKAAGKN